MQQAVRIPRADGRCGPPPAPLPAGARGVDPDGSSVIERTAE